MSFFRDILEMGYPSSAVKSGVEVKCLSEQSTLFSRTALLGYSFIGLQEHGKLEGQLSLLSLLKPSTFTVFMIVI